MLHSVELSIQALLICLRGAEMLLLPPGENEVLNF